MKKHSLRKIMNQDLTMLKFWEDYYKDRDPEASAEYTKQIQGIRDNVLGKSKRKAKGPRTPRVPVDPTLKQQRRKLRRQRRKLLRSTGPLSDSEKTLLKELLPLLNQLIPLPGTEQSLAELNQIARDNNIEI